MAVLRNLIFYFVFYLGTALYVLAGTVVYVFGAMPVRWVAGQWSAFHRVCVHLILGIKVRIEGAPDLNDGPVLYALKHESFFEAIDLPTLLNLPVIFAKAELLRLPFWGKVAANYGLIAVERDQGAKALRTMISTARRLTADGRSLAIFPEGTRVAHGTRPHLQSGFAGIYKLLNLAVIPVALDSGPCYQRRWKRRGTITYRFGQKIPAGLPREEVEARVHAAINELNANSLND